MAEMRTDIWDLSLKTLALAGAFIGATLALWQYFDTSEKAFRAPYWERQLDTYFAATEATGLLASSTDPAVRQDAERRFWQLYYGPLALVEDAGVEAAMVAFGRCLQSPDCGRERLGPLSLALAHACRSSIGDSWSLPLEALEGRYDG